MATKKRKIPTTPITGSEDVPPGATRKAFEREEMPGGGAPGSGGGERHGAGEPGGGFDHEGLADNPDVDPTVPPEGDDSPGLAGSAGGAVGGTPAGKRSSGKRVGEGFAPDASARGDSTVGANPES